MNYASVISLIISINYVLSVYINSKGADRNDPIVIKQRLWNVGLISVVNCVIVVVYLRYVFQFSVFESLVKIGFIPSFTNINQFFVYVYEIIKIFILLNILYVGPLFDEFLISGNLDAICDLKHQLKDIYSIRDHLVGPLTEEITYTSLLLNISSPPVDDHNILYCFYKSLYFGIAHIHHAYYLLKQEQYQGQYGTVFTSCFIQLLYTTIFGTYTNLQFIRSGNNLASCILAHIICNIYGLPQAPRALSSGKYVALLVVGLFSFVYLGRLL